MARKRPVYCSFCGKSDKEVRCMIVGQDVAICYDCVCVCVDEVGKAFGVRRGELLTEDPDHGDDDGAAQP